METTTKLLTLFLFLTGTFFEVSLAGRIFGPCDFETDDMCGLTGEHGFISQSGRPSWDIQAMHSGYSGHGFLLLKSYNSEGTLITPFIEHGGGTVELSFAYYLHGDGHSKSRIRVEVESEAGVQQIFEVSKHHSHWRHVTLPLSVAPGQSFLITWKVYAYKNTWTQQHDWLGLDLIEVVENGGLDACFRPPPVQYAQPWACTSPTQIDSNVGPIVNEELPDGTVCTSSCLDGFAMQGHPTVKCSDGAWQEKGQVIFMCIDNTAPQFNPCPSDSELETPFGWASMWYTVSPPDVSDNTGAFDLQLSLDGELQQDSSVTVVLNPGSYDVLFVATDLYNNKNSCSYSLAVDVSDKEAPEVAECPISQVIESDRPVSVTWVQPVFTDNTGYIDKIESNYENGTLMAWGDHIVELTAYDNSSNSGSCSFAVTITGLPCTILDMPVNGALACHDSFAGSFCVSMCSSLGEFQLPSAEFTVPSDYLCSTSGNWYPYEFTYNCMAPYGSEIIMPENYYFQGACNETKTQDDIRTQALAIFDDSAVDITLGRNLTKFDFYVHCGELSL